MRFAKVLDVWRGLYRKQFQSKILGLEFSNVLGIGSGRLSFSGGITVICGANGVGKTTLLNALLLSIKNIPEPLPQSIKNRFSNSNLVVSVSENGNASSYTKNGVIDGEGVASEIYYVESANKSSRLIDFFSSLADKQEILETFGSVEYNAEELSLLSYVTGKNYESCHVYEIDDFGENEVIGFEDVIPYFQVLENGISYGIEMMGLGELAAHLLIWYIRRAANNSILFLEEPESFISPKAQIHLMNYIASSSLRKGIWSIITTHSMGIVSNVPLDHIKVVSKSATGISIIENPSQFQLNMILGVSFSYTGILFVEDLASKIFAKVILAHFDGDLSRRFDVLIAGSASAISSVLYSMPKTSSNWLKIIGLYDGDQRNAGASVIDARKTDWYYDFLPTSFAPEVVFRSYFRGNHSILANRLAIREQDLELGLNQFDASNHHDWSKDLSEFLAINEEHILNVMFRVWIEDAANEPNALACFNGIQRNFTS